MVRAPCDHDLAHRRRVFWIQQRPRNCRCDWHRLSHAAAEARGLRSSEVCRCRPDHQVRRCEPPGLGKPAIEKIIHIHYFIQDGECESTQRVEVRPVVCGPPDKTIRCVTMSTTHLIVRLSLLLIC